MPLKRTTSTAKITYTYTSARFYPVFLTLTIASFVIAIASIGWFFYKSTKVDLGTYLPSNVSLNGFEPISKNGQSVTQPISLNTAYSTVPITGTDVVPQMASLYFKPLVVSDGGMISAEGSAIWKVYWNPIAQTQITIALQWQPSGISATQQVTTSGRQLLNPSQINSNSNMNIAAEGSVNGIKIPNGVSQIWQGSFNLPNSNVKVNADVLIFNVDQKVVAVTMTKFGSSGLSLENFKSLSQGEYRLLNSDPSLPFVYLSLSAVVLMLIFSFISIILKGRKGTRYMFVDLPKENEIQDKALSESEIDSPFVPAGWYHDPYSPNDANNLRYFDGSVWTEHTTALP